MRISDWSSDVCSSDLLGTEIFLIAPQQRLGIQTCVDGQHEDKRHQIPGTGRKHRSQFQHRPELRFDRREQIGVCFQQLRVAWYGVRENLIHGGQRSEEHTSELQSLMRISYAVFCLK